MDGPNRVKPNQLVVNDDENRFIDINIDSENDEKSFKEKSTTKDKKMLFNFNKSKTKSQTTNKPPKLKKNIELPKLELEINNYVPSHSQTTACNSSNLSQIVKEANQGGPAINNNNFNNNNNNTNHTSNNSNNKPFLNNNSNLTLSQAADILLSNLNEIDLYSDYEDDEDDEIDEDFSEIAKRNSHKQKQQFSNNLDLSYDFNKKDPIFNSSTLSAYQTRNSTNLNESNNDLSIVSDTSTTNAHNATPDRNHSTPLTSNSINSIDNYAHSPSMSAKKYRNSEMIGQTDILDDLDKTLNKSSNNSNRMNKSPNNPFRYKPLKSKS
jgi:hypothetical protein